MAAQSGSGAGRERNGGRRHLRAVASLDRVERMGGKAETVEEARCGWPEALLVEPAPKPRARRRIKRRRYARAT